MPLAADTRLGPYEIVSPLGIGAMGEVYRARDTRLNREVALKVIPPNSAIDDTERRHRLQQEARAASALNHPNILTVHEFGTLHGISYIVSELIEGESLRAVISRGPLPLKRLLEIAIQISDGLGAAHQAGILHRDLKPENIMLTGDGRVKLLDFGLAKPIVDSESFDLNETADLGTGREFRTEPGVLLGTVAYMSPEQAAGKKLDYSSDQFSFGIILHEMATGQHPYRRQNALETLMAVAHSSQPPFTPGPVAFRLVVERCLARDPARRFPTTDEVAKRLRKIREEMLAAPVNMEVVETGTSRLRYSVRSYRKPLALGLLAAAAGVAFWLGFPYLERFSHRETLSYSPLVTNASGSAFPSWSPSGDTVAYAGNRDGRFQIFTRRLESGSPIAATNCDGDCLEPAWSADGSRLFYLSADEKLWSVGSAGGSPQPILESVGRAAISGDGKHLAVLRREDPEGETFGVWIGTPSGSSLRRAATGEFAGRLWLRSTFLAFPPAKNLLAVYGVTSRGLPELWILDGEKQAARRVPVDFVDALPAPFAWTANSKSLVLTSAGHLVTVDPESGEVRPLTAGTGAEQFPGVAPRGGRLAFTAGRMVHRTMRYSLLGGPGADVSSTNLGEWSPAWPPNGDPFAYVAGRSRRSEIWIRSEGGWTHRLVTEAKFPESRTLGFSGVSFSGDGQRLVFSRDGTDGRHIWIAPISGDSPVRAVPAGTALEEAPAWSPDNGSIAFLALASGRWKLAVSAPGSGEIRFLADAAQVGPSWSPDSARLAFATPDGRLAVIGRDGSGLRTVSEGRWLVSAWARDGKSIAGLKLNSANHLLLGSVQPDAGLDQTLSDLGVRPATLAIAQALGTRPALGAALTPDGTALLVGLLSAQPEIWIGQRAAN